MNAQEIKRERVYIYIYIYIYIYTHTHTHTQNLNFLKFKINKHFNGSLDYGKCSGRKFCTIFVLELNL